MTYLKSIKIIEKELLHNLGTGKAEAYRMAINAMELQIAKKPVDGKSCPNCGERITFSARVVYARCGNCGQKLKWG